MQHKQDWFTITEVKTAFASFGLIDENFVRQLSFASFAGAIYSHGFLTIHYGEEIAQATERVPLSSRLWRYFKTAFGVNCASANRVTMLNFDWENGCFEYRVHRTLPDDPRPPEHIFCSLDTHGNAISYELRRSTATVQEHWSNVMFDRYSVEKFLSEYRKRSQANVLQDSEIVAWIENCGTQNSKTAWEQFKKDYGIRTGKKYTFTRLWPKRRVGRPSIA
jgi:hypothetical protein